MTGAVVIDIPAHKEYVAVVRQVVSIIAGKDGLLGPGRVDDLILAVSEACANAIEAYAGADGRVMVRVAESDFDSGGGVVVTVEDDGPGFDPDVLDVASPGGDSVAAERGRGIAIMRALVDEVSIEPSPKGTAVTLRCRGGS